jgi:hypothetical protein
MELNDAIKLIKGAVKNNSTTGNNHIDLGLAPANKREEYEKALVIIKLSILKGEISQDEFAARVHL